MKIVHISHLYHPSEGGVQSFFKNISERLVNNYGDDVTLVTSDSIYGPERKIYKNAGPKHEVINGVKVIRFSYRKWHIKPYAYLSKIFRRLCVRMPEAWTLKAHGPYSKDMIDYLTTVEADAFCASSVNYYFMQLPLWRKCNFYYYGSVHFNENEKKSPLLPTQLKSVKSSTLYLANTAYEKYRLEKLGVNPSKVFILGTGVDINDFEVEDKEVQTLKVKLGLPSGALVVGYIGRIERQKNVQLLIKSFALIANDHPQVYLLLAGSANTHVGELQSFIAATHPTLADRIKWMANFSPAEKPLVFNAIDILVLPSHNESFGIVFLEAWSCKKPVIGTLIGAIRNVISEGEDGLLINVNDEASLATQLVKLIENKPLRELMGENGHEKVRANYTWDIIVARLRQCYVSGVVNKKELVNEI
jgi:glycosyltransferase involved in cell wall biosynthesis